MTEQAQLKTTKPFTGWHMLIIMLSFFGVIIIVNLTMATLATKSWTGLVVKNGYIASQQFNNNQAAQEKLLAAGWKSKLDYHDGTFTLSLLAHEKPISGCAVASILSRPVHENSNRALQFKENNAGQYIANSALSSGRWTLNVKALCHHPSSAQQGTVNKNSNQTFIQNFKFLVSTSPDKK